MTPLTIQIRIEDKWLSIGTIRLLEREALGLSAKTEFCYDIDYATRFVERTDYRAVSCLAPVTFEPLAYDSWPPFLLDLFPQGAALKYVVEHYRVLDRPEYYWQILHIARLNPPGNLRVLTALAPSPVTNSSHPGFSKSEVTSKGADFLEYMIQRGAPVAGTTGAGGAAPKFLLREDHHGRFFADGVLADAQTKHCWLVKFPRGKHTTDAAILFAEKAYYDIASAVGLRTHRPLEWQDDCLFMHRFDRPVTGQHVDYLALESFYSMAGLPEFGSRMEHQTYLSGLSKFSSDPEADIIEYCLRDLLNQMMGNTDNHGRNQSLLKGDGWTRLAPLYDFAPMKFDREGIVRNTRWNDAIEQGDLDALTRLLIDDFHIDKDLWLNALKYFCTKTGKIEEMMQAHHVTKDFILGTRVERVRTQKAMNDLCGSII